MEVKEKPPMVVSEEDRECGVVDTHENKHGDPKPWR